MTGAKWEYASRAAVMTMMSSFGGGCSCIIYSLIEQKGRISVLHVINGILGSLVSITAGCFLYEAWNSLVIGCIGALLVCITMPIFDRVLHF